MKRLLLASAWFCLIASAALSQQGPSTPPINGGAVGPLTISGTTTSSVENTAAQTDFAFNHNGGQGAVNYQRKDNPGVVGPLEEQCWLAYNSAGADKYMACINVATSNLTSGSEAASMNVQLETPGQFLVNGTITGGGAGSSAGYAVNDNITLLNADGSASAGLSASVKVLTVDGGGGVLTFVVNSGGIFVTLPTSFTQASTTGVGSGFTLGSPSYGANQPFTFLNIAPFALTLSNGQAILIPGGYKVINSVTGLITGPGGFFALNGKEYGWGDVGFSRDSVTSGQIDCGNGTQDSVSCKLKLAQISGLTTPLTIAQGGTGAATTSQNLVFAGPTSGSGAPSFRALVASDVPAAPPAFTQVLYASLPAASSNSGTFYEVTDVGENCTLGSATACGGSIWTSDGTRWKPAGKIVLCKSGAAINSTGTTAEVTLASCTIPANALGINGSLDVQAVYTVPANTNTRYGKIRYTTIGGVAYWVSSSVSATILTLWSNFSLSNRGVTNAQVAGNSTFFSTLGQGTAAVVTSAVDTTASTTLVIDGASSSAGDTITLERYQVVLVP